MIWYEGINITAFVTLKVPNNSRQTTFKVAIEIRKKKKRKN